MKSIKNIDRSQADPDTELDGMPKQMNVRSVDKAFRVLNAFDAANPVMGLTQLASKLGVAKSEAQRFTHTLIDLGYLRKDPITRMLSLGIKTLDLAHHYLRSNTVLQSASSLIAQLNSATEETVNLVILDDTEVVFVQRMVSRHVFNENVVIGSRLPAYCTAMGLAILSKLDPAVAEDIVRRSDLRPFTPQTIYKVSDVLKRIKELSKRDYVITDREYFNDIAIGAAILNVSREPIAAVSVAVSPARRNVVEAETQFSALLLDAARSISA